VLRVSLKLERWADEFIYIGKLQYAFHLFFSAASRHEWIQSVGNGLISGVIE
jgi:hypothetical protein